METILFFPRSLKNDHLSLIRQKIALLSNWNVPSTGTGLSPVEARDLIAFWRPVACIVNDDRLPADLFDGIPSTFLHRDPSAIPPDADYVTFDEREIGRMAAQELLPLDLASYGYVADVGAEFWNAERERAFVQAMSLNGRGVVLFTPPPTRNLARMQERLARWLRDLPRPAGLFAACDTMAEHVVNACLHAGLAIPEDVVLLGVDNNAFICESSRPTLTSIECDAVQTRLPYLKHLQRRIADPGLPGQIFRIPPQRLVRRASTRRFPKADAAVQTACETIRTRACSGLTAREVAAAFPCSRRMAEMRFRTATGQSILEAIRLERRSTAERLLRENQLTSDAIAAHCGYSSPSSVYRLLRNS